MSLFTHPYVKDFHSSSEHKKRDALKKVSADFMHMQGTQLSNPVKRTYTIQLVYSTSSESEATQSLFFLSFFLFLFFAACFVGKHEPLKSFCIYLIIYGGGKLVKYGA